MSMKSLLTAIQTSLRNAATLSAVGDANIFITPDEGIIPQAATFPALGLRDGNIDMQLGATALGGHLWEVEYYVHVIIYVSLTDGETPIVGQAAPAILGTTDLNDLVRAVLHENYQSIAGIIDARCVAESESQIIGNDDEIIVIKIMTFKYQAEEVL